MPDRDKAEPNRANWRKDNELATVHMFKMVQLSPNRAWPRTDTALPNLANVNKDMLLPTVTESKTLTELAVRIKP